MKAWLKLTAMFFGIALLSGCSTGLTLPHGPDIYSLSMKPNAPKVVVARVADNRQDKQHLGSISALQVQMKADPTELVAKEMVAALYDQDVNGVLGRVSATDSPDTLAAAAAENNADGVLVVSIQALAIASFDALMDPPTATATLTATLYDSAGQKLDSDSAMGQVQRRINTFVAEKSTGELLNEAIRAATQKLAASSIISTLKNKAAAPETEPEAATTETQTTTTTETTTEAPAQ